MGDCFTSQQRSRIMSSIKGKDTKVELLVRRYLFRQGFRYRIHDSHLMGHPDVVLPKYHAVVFINGCFWHGHEGCPYYKAPKNNTSFWEQKIEKNRERDKRISQSLLDQGWRVFVVWECELRKRDVREATLQGLVNEIWDVD
ncbi:MAG: very short patch repair endonuclease [Sphaerochaeta sp.]|nr:very short patch repair endonuclease [Sphaerochaeta sp.]